MDKPIEIPEEMRPYLDGIILIFLPVLNEILEPISQNLTDDEKIDCLRVSLFAMFAQAELYRKQKAEKALRN